MLRSVVFLALWVLMTLLLGVVCLPCLATQRSAIAFCNGWVSLTLWLHRTVCRVTYDVRGALPDAPFMVASAHQSALDTFLLWHHLRAPIFILKRELYLIPIYGWYVWRAGHIAVNRKAKVKPLQQMLATAQREVGKGRVLVIFPEGTRVKPGEVKPYHRGVATLSHSLQLPVVPVALNTGHFWPKHSMRKASGTVRVQFLPVMAACGDDTQGWMQQLQQTISVGVAACHPANAAPEIQMHS